MKDATINQSDEALFLNIQKGDEKAFDTLFLKYYGVLCAYAKQFVGFEEREEIVQDVMVWLWENRAMVSIETSPKHYLFRAVKNSCFSLINRNETRLRIVAKLHEHLHTVYEDCDFYIVEELSEQIERALNRLPDTYREAFELNRFQNMTYREIADKLQVSSKTIDYRIQQSLKLLRIELKEYLPLLLAIV